ncbi:MAG: hypothetical protein ABMA01_04275 [Chthoniobacteraceae bacterium]
MRTTPCSAVVGEGTHTAALEVREGGTTLSGLKIIREGLRIEPLPSPLRAAACF